MHKPDTLNLLIYLYDVKLKYLFHTKHDFYINFTSHLCIKLMCNVLMYVFFVVAITFNVSVYA